MPQHVRGQAVYKPKGTPLWSWCFGVTDRELCPNMGSAWARCLVSHVALMTSFIQVTTLQQISEWWLWRAANRIYPEHMSVSIISWLDWCMWVDLQLIRPFVMWVLCAFCDFCVSSQQSWKITHPCVQLTKHNKKTFSVNITHRWKHYTAGQPTEMLFTELRQVKGQPISQGPTKKGCRDFIMSNAWSQMVRRITCVLSVCLKIILSKIQ